MNTKRTLRSFVIGFVPALVLSTPVLADAIGRIVLPVDPAVNPHVIQFEPLIKVKVDENPLTSEWVVFEVVVDSSGMTDVWGFEWQISVSGDGLGFDAATSETLTNTMMSDSVRAPGYLLFNDSFGFDVVPSAKGIRGSDLSDSLSTYNPVGKSLGLFAVEVTDEASALGLHTLQDPLSFLFDTGFNEEGLDIGPTDFEVVPEPGTLSLLALGFLGAGIRRSSRRS